MPTSVHPLLTSNKDKKLKEFKSHRKRIKKLKSALKKEREKVEYWKMKLKELRKKKTTAQEFGCANAGQVDVLPKAVSFFFTEVQSVRYSQLN